MELCILVVENSLYMYSKSGIKLAKPMKFKRQVQ